ncbi:MAG: hypothetical protein C0467_25130 [Planctomycetaceae bacterium]|nr:hypothetical protein [Planctomycetaceae bacterium]
MHGEFGKLSLPIVTANLDVRPHFFILIIIIGPRLFTPRLRPRYARCLPSSLKATVVGERWFYRSDEEWISIAEQLKNTPCPHCHARGTLNRHGVLYGFDNTNDSNSQQRTLRARRILCSKRRQSRPGCGRTFSIWLAHKIRRFSLSTRTLLTFLQHAVVGTIANACKAVNHPRSERTFQRIWKRFDHTQIRIRTALLGRGPPPESSAASARRPEATQVLDHLQASFPNTDCPSQSLRWAAKAAVEDA